jgi:O-antigen/teichoic acid export membrane protein
VPLTLHYLGPERYGMWMVMSSLIAMLGFADLGVGNGLLNAIAGAHGRDDKGEAVRYVSSAFFTLVAISLLVLVAFAIAYTYVPWSGVFNVDSPLAVAESGPAVAVLLLSFVIGMPLGVISRVRAGYQEGFIDSAWIIAGNLLSLALVLLAIAARAGLPVLVLAMASGPLLATAMNGIELFWRRSPWLRPRWSAASRTAARAVLGTGLYFFVLQIAGAVAYQSDSIVLAQVMGPDAVAEYAVTMKLFMIVPMAMGLLFVSLWPAYAEALSRGDRIWAMATLRRSIWTAVLIGAPSSVALVAVGKPLIRLWVGSSVEPSTLLLAAAGAWAALNCVGGAFASFFNGAGLLRLPAVLSVFLMIGNLALSILMTMRIGVSGVLWGSVIAQVVFMTAPMTAFLIWRFRRTKPSTAV